MKTTHRLVSVIFADIAGYTAMMESNEEQALRNLQIFKDAIEDAAENYGGNVMQFYGDGFLAVFESSTDAVDAAISIQGVYIKNNLPVRIGIHSGEVVFKEDNVFGDAVNVASRIESVGIPHGILVSALVRDQLKNKKEYNFVSLGSFEFKNLVDPVEVYALEKQGFIVPIRDQMTGKLKPISATSISDGDLFKIFKRVVSIVVALAFLYWVLAVNKILPWVSNNDLSDINKGGIKVTMLANDTGIDSLDYIGHFISTDVSKGLEEMGKAKVIPASFMPHIPYARELLKKLGFGSDFAKEMGVGYLLMGSYRMEMDKLKYSVQILDSRTGQSKIFLDDVYSGITEEEITKGRDAVVQEVIGAWMSKDQSMYSHNAPTASCFKEYEKALQIWGEGFETKVLEHLKKCQEYDSTFVQAQIIELIVHFRIGAYENVDSLLQILEAKEIEFTDYERNFFLSVKSGLLNNNKKDHEYFMNLYTLNPNDIFINNGAVSSALVLLNDPKLALDLGKNINWKDLDLNVCIYCKERLIILAFSHIALENYQEAQDIFSHLESEKIGSVDILVKIGQIRSLARINDFEGLYKLLEDGKSLNLAPYNHIYLWVTAVKELYLLENNQEIQQFIIKGIQAIESDTSGSKHIESLAYLNFYDEKYEESSFYFKKLIDNPNTLYKDYYISDYGVVLGMQNKEEEALKIIEYLKTKNPKYKKGNLKYKIAKVWASLGRYEDAIRSLNHAMEEGKYYNVNQFLFEPAFIPIFKDQEFQQILNRYIK